MEDRRRGGDRPRVLAIALDAAHGSLVLRWAEEGRLPSLHRLMSEGATVRLRSFADRFPESVWPSINTGCRPGAHGIYNWRCVRPRDYSLVWVPSRTHRQPFWRLLSGDGSDAKRTAVLVDIPYCTPLRDDTVTELVGWGQRGASLRTSWPPDLMNRVVARHGSYPRWVEADYDRSAFSERRVLRALERLAGVRTGVILDLARDRPWDLCLACYWETHIALHSLYRYCDPGPWPHDERRARRVGDGLLRVYRAADAGIGRLIETAGGETDVVVFSGGGARPNTTGGRLLPRVLSALGYQVPARVPSRALPVHSLRAALPWSIRQWLHFRLPQSARARLMERLWLEAIDWSRTRAFAESEPGHGWIRINVRGREPEGTVDAGPEYERLRDEIANELLSLTNADTGTPAVVRVARREELFDGPHVDELPDLIVTWSQDALLRAAYHPRIGVIRDDLRDVPRTEHSGEGFVVASGPSIRSVEEAGSADVVDLAPTLLYLLGSAIPADMEGQVLEGILEPSLLATRPQRRERLEWDDDPWGPELAGREA
jgi:predicted AlkP superfamily phosphohydrolase/phosphomutase